MVPASYLNRRLSAIGIHSLQIGMIGGSISHFGYALSNLYNSFATVDLIQPSHYRQVCRSTPSSTFELRDVHLLRNAGTRSSGS